MQPDRAGDAVRHATALLDALGVPDTEATKDTPARLVRALAELTAGLHLDPARHLAVTFPPEADDPGMVVVTDITFTSVCEHHLLPFTGRAAVAYLPSPGARIVGLSKLARLVADYAARPQVQERLGHQIAQAVVDHLDTLGAGVVLRSTHSCMTIRGARSAAAEMTTSHLHGAFRDDPTVRAEFLALTRGGA